MSLKKKIIIRIEHHPSNAFVTTQTMGFTSIKPGDLVTSLIVVGEGKSRGCSTIWIPTKNF
jgi:hypothetical protein